MKPINILKTGAAIMAIALFTACQPAKNQNDDTVEVAKDQNDEALDNRDEEKDADFIVNAVAANLAEIKLAQLALTKSTDVGVKKMAAMLEIDHTKVLKELQGYATKKGISIPVAETNDATEDRNDLAEKDGKEFNEKWCSLLKDKHEKTINMFEKRIDKTEDMELKDWVATTLPGLKKHLEMLEEHEDRTKIGLNNNK